MSVSPSMRCRNTPLPGKKWSGLVVAKMMQSRSLACRPARASAILVASAASVEHIVPGSTQCRCRMPVRWVIHSSDVSISVASSSFVTTRGGT